MKTFLSILILGIIFLAGCTDKDFIVGPENNLSAAPNWITLPERKGGSAVESQFSSTKHILGNEGGEIKIDLHYPTPGGPFNEVRVNVKIKFDKDSFAGSEDITMIVDNENGTITYSPAMNFVKPAKLNVKFEGLDLTGINPDSVNFVYYDPSGNYGQVDYNDLKVDLNHGKLELKEGKIPHFSKYGFSR